MAVTLDEIAELAGVGRSTVSRVLNNDPRVRDATRERILEIVRRENYQPNFAARSLASGRSDVIGAVVPMALPSVFTDPFFPQFLEGVSVACDAADAMLMLWLAPPETERRKADKVGSSGPVDGLIIAAHVSDDPFVETLRGGKKQFVLYGRYAADDVSYVTVDDRASARGIVSHLLRVGHKRVATITGPQHMFDARDRLDGYLDALREFRLPHSPELIVEGDWSEESGAQAMRRLLTAKPDAVFAANDSMALAALRVLRENGLRVPEDVALAGFDDIPAAAAADPPLTTVRQPIRRLGEVATQTLLEMIDDPDGPPRRVILPTELVVRASCGSVGKSAATGDAFGAG
ncbi:MAG TPA: LacI family DNA-binding transcriptional regulator [Microbacteriaceae bacterium]|nr:LacI family DNA-binding transcriptional regulator [Microbacteriaceae bacterium]